MKPTHLQPYSRPACYIGATFEGTYVIYTVHRDSDSVTRSNWRVLLRHFDAQIGNEDDGDPLFVTRASHWAVGWIDTLRLQADANPTLITEIDTMIGRLDDYPLLNEDDHSDLEWNEAAEYWQQMSVKERVEYLQRAELSVFAARRPELPGDDNGRLFELLTRV